MPSLTLAPGGEERSQIMRHWLGWCNFGTRPRGLVWIPGSRWDGMGPSSLPAATSELIRWSMTLKLAREDGWFLPWDLSCARSWVRYTYACNRHSALEGCAMPQWLRTKALKKINSMWVDVQLRNKILSADIYSLCSHEIAWGHIGVDNFFVVGGACVATPNFLTTPTYYYITTMAVVL